MKLSIDNINDIVVGSHETLLSYDCDHNVMKYLLNDRGIEEKTIKAFQIGYCSNVIESMINKDYYNNSSNYPMIKPDFLRDKLIFPIRDDCGNLSSFATRSIGKKSNWWNYPFIKGNILYGLNNARARSYRENKLYIVEGYLDCCILWQFGLANTASVMGTRLTMIHAGLIKRYCDNICLCFDADPMKEGKMGSGQKATLKTYENIKDFFNITSINLPMSYDKTNEQFIGMDPDTYVINNGLEELLNLECKIEKEVCSWNKN